MITRYENGTLIESWDDATRTYTDHRTGESRPYTPAENAAADARAEAETRLDDLEARVAALEAVVMAAAVPDDPADPDVPTWADLTPAGWWYDGALLKDTDGTIYRNTSGTVLTTPPSGFPGGGVAWRGRLFVVVTGGTSPDPDPPAAPPAWSPDASYEVGDKVTHNGRVWECLVAHGAEYQGTWAPGVAHTVWADLGPAGATTAGATTTGTTSKGTPRK